MVAADLIGEVTAINLTEGDDPQSDKPLSQSNIGHFIELLLFLLFAIFMSTRLIAEAYFRVSGKH